MFIWVTFLEHLLCAKLCASHVDAATHLTPPSAVGVGKAPHFTDGHTEAQWDEVSYYEVQYVMAWV